MLNATPNSSLALNGNVLWYECHKGHEWTHGERGVTITCTNKQWTALDAECKSKHSSCEFVPLYFEVCVIGCLFTETDCGPPPAMLHSTVHYNNTLFLSSALYKCEEGFWLQNLGRTPFLMTYCSANGSWSLTEEIPDDAVAQCTGAPHL